MKRLSLRLFLKNISTLLNCLVCIDCVVIWGKWGPCANGIRTRSAFVSVEVVGAGKTCPELLSESEGDEKRPMLSCAFLTRRST